MPVPGDTVRLIQTGNTEYLFSAKTGMLKSVKVNGKMVPFKNGPVLCEGQAEPDSVLFSINEKASEVTVTAHYPAKSLISRLQWTILVNGVLKMEIRYFPTAYFTNFAGVSFSYPEKEIKSIVYFGKGPYRVWKNRMKGALLGVWEKEYNNTETGEFPWKYPEFKGYHAQMYWCRFIGRDHSFSVYTETEDLFLRLFTPAWKTDQWHNYEPLFPSGDISFMQGISSIGSKTQRNETTGPMGQKNIFYDYEKEKDRALKIVLWFNFSGD